MSTGASFASFERELNRLVATFEKNFTHYQEAGYDEASLRQEFLNPLFVALGWDVENKAGHIPKHREVEVESRTTIGGRQKRARPGRKRIANSAGWMPRPATFTSPWTSNAAS